MQRYELEELVEDPWEPNPYDPKDNNLWETESERRELFIKPLEIDKIVTGLFRFSSRETSERVIDIIMALEYDLDLRKRRQDALKFMMENDKLGEIVGLFNSYNRMGISGIDFWLRDGSTGQGPTFLPYTLDHFMNSINSRIDLLEELAPLTKDSVFERTINALLENTRSSDWYKEAKRVLPLIPQLADELSKIAYHDFHDYSDFYEDRPSRKEFKIESNLDYVRLCYMMQNSDLPRIILGFDYFINLACGYKRLKEEGANLIFPTFRELGGNERYRCCDIKGGVSPLLYMGENRDKPKIPNDFFTDELQPAVVIRGENKYGKTIGLKTRGHVSAFGNAGHPVIADSAELSYVDTIFANIGVTQDSLRGLSQYQAVNETTFRIINLSSGIRGLLLLDEPTGGTYEEKGELQAIEYLRELARGGYEVWTVTHFDLSELEKERPDIIFLKTEIRDGQYTYRLVPGVFEPTRGDVVLDYTAEEICKAMKQKPELRQQHLERLLARGEIPEDRKDLIYRILEKDNPIKAPQS